MLYYQDNSDKILLTGICYIHRLLRLKYNNDNNINNFTYTSNPIKYTNPKFDITKVDFFKNHISDKFIFSDFMNRFSSVDMRTNNLPELLNLYGKMCRRMYVLGGTGIAPGIDRSTIIKPTDYLRYSRFWFFFFNENWNPNTTKNWIETRDKAIFQILKKHDNLKFIFYNQSCMDWWKKSNLPRDRAIYWDIQYSLTNSELQTLQEEFRDQGHIPHGFPTEDSYNELCDLILKDCMFQ